MNQRRHTTFVAAAATILASLPLMSVFDTWAWLVDAVLAVAVIVGVGLLVRSVRAPIWAPTLAMSVGFFLTLTWMFRSGHELLGLLPTPSTLVHFNQLLLQAGTDMRDLGVPVPDRPGLLFLSTRGIGAVALAVDLFAVVLRRPALAGLPMLAIYSVPVAVRQDSVNFVPFAAGAAGFLWLLVTDNIDKVRRFGRRFTGDGRGVDGWEPSPLAAAGRRLAFVGVIIAIAVPVIVPGSNTGLLDKFGSEVGGGTGTGTGRGNGASVDLYAVLSGELNRDSTFDMVKVQTTDPNPFYLRFGVADQLTNNGFVNQAPRSGQSATAGLPPAAALNTPGVTGKPYKAQVQILNLNMRLLPIYLQPTKTEKLDSSWLYDRTSQVIYSRRTEARGKTYGLDYLHLDYSPDALRTARGLDASDPIQRAYTQVTPIPEVDSILSRIIANQPTPYDKVRAIHAYFSADNGFKYSLKTEPGTSGNAIVDFLRNKQGFCEQYSAAMAWLVRAAGIPSRVAFGYSRGTRSGDTWTLSNRNLHAWTEVYFDKFGWVPFDATPASFVSGVDSAWAPDPNKVDSAPGGSVSGGNVPGGPPTGPGASPGANGNLPNERADNPSGALNGGTGSPTWPLWTLVAILVLLALLAAPGIWRYRLRRRRWPSVSAGPKPVPVTVAPGSPEMVVTDDGTHGRARQRAHAAWDELVDTLTDHRMSVDVSATPRMTAERVITVASLTGGSATGARTLGHAEERARYARTPLDDDDLAGALRDVRTAIAGRVSWQTRVRALLMPPSVVERWRAAAGQVIGRWTDTVIRWRARVAAVASPTRFLRRRTS